MKDTFARFFDASGCCSQVELAALLGVRQALVADAKKQNNIPDDWLRRLQKVHDINPHWVLTGEDPKYMNNKDSWGEAPDLRRPTAEGLGSYSSKDLTDELLRRTGPYNGAEQDKGSAG